ncbi:hypothetical protein ACFQ1I_40120 [Kitasatospora arboriphila]
MLTPAWEKYAQHSEEFRPPASVRLPDPMPDHHYVTALYAPYKSGTAAATTPSGTSRCRCTRTRRGRATGWCSPAA